MKKITTKQIVTIAIVIALAIIGYYFWTTGTPGYVKKYQAQIDSAQHNIDSLQVELDLSDQMIDSMGAELTILERENSVLKEDIKDIKKEANEKINAIDKLNNDELSEFFTDRYQTIR